LYLFETKYQQNININYNFFFKDNINAFKKYCVQLIVHPFNSIKLLNNILITIINFDNITINKFVLSIYKKLTIYYKFNTELFNTLELFENNYNFENIYYNYEELDDTWDIDNNIRHQISKGPIRLVKHLLTPEYTRDNTDLLKFNFYDNSNQTSIKVPDNDNF
jgi:hypothetical protein